MTEKKIKQDRTIQRRYSNDNIKSITHERPAPKDQAPKRRDVPDSNKK